MAVEYIDRPPRIQPELPRETVEIPKPPDQDEKSANSAIMHALLPLVTVLGYVILAATGQGRNLTLMIPLAMASVASVVFALVSYRQQQGSGDEERESYLQRMATMRREMRRSHDMQRTFYLYNYPSVETVLKIASQEEVSRSGPRLWERRPTDQDFGFLRLGMGTRPSTVRYKMSRTGEGTEDPLYQEAEQIARESQFVDDVPITIPLRPDATRSKHGDDDEEENEFRLEPRHSLGIAGESVAKVSDFVRAILVQFTAFHAPTDARLLVVGGPNARRRWEWATWLPHTNTRPGRYTGDQMTFNEADYTAFFDTLRDELDKRALRLQDRDDDGDDVTLPFLLVVVDRLALDADSPLHTAESEAAISLIMRRGLELGAAVMFMVSDAARTPSDCQAVIEIEPVGTEVAFRYAEIGLNTPRFLGTADSIDGQRAEAEFSYLVRDYAVRRSASDDVVTYIDILEMFGHGRVHEMPFATNWERSRTEEGAEWMKVPLGAMSGNKIRTLHMHQDVDGVHGMIAGTTGSGKSELLLTLIAGLAVRYDPTILNFALVDYKGGSAFEPFRELPHTVDIVTNLEGNAVERMFIAIKAELDRRGKILKDYNVKHIVQYREKGYHHEQPFPHLLIIVDEFAEMVSENAEYKARFDSITRLGRAIGVSLILATQRPTGAVTDQMRANMKFKMCLRVETVDDSRELLKRSDAAYLPSNLPGRTYLQVGNENLELIQVARAGGSYSAEEVAELPDVIWLDEVQEPVMKKDATLAGEVISSRGSSMAHRSIHGMIIDDDTDFAAIGSNGYSEVNVEYSINQIADAINGTPETMVDWIVGTCARLANELNVPVQKKPWPDPLPPVLPLNLPIEATYINHERSLNPTLTLVPALTQWSEGGIGWQDINWRGDALSVDIGIVDNPYASEQRILTLDLKRGPVVLFGAPGWGKSTFLRSLMIGLAARHSPNDLIMYALDFGKGGLSAVKALPHLGAAVDSTEEQRVERLLRMLENILDERRPLITEYGSLAAYNAENPDEALPAVLTVIDNFGEFRESYEAQMPTLSSLVRDGRAFGLYFAVTAAQTNDMPGKLYNLFTERLSLKLPDSTEYTMIVGRGAPNFNDVQGRGVVSVDRTPMEFHCGLPVRPDFDFDDETAILDEGEMYESLSQAMAVAWEGPLPEPVEILKERILLGDLLDGTKGEKPLTPIIGINDLDRDFTRIDLTKMGPHFLVTGPPLSGKTTALRTLVLSMAYANSPAQVTFVLVDPKRTTFGYGGERSFTDLPHVLGAVNTPDDLAEVFARLAVEFDDEKIDMLRGTTEDIHDYEGERPAVVVVMDNFSDLDALGKIDGRNPTAVLADIIRQFGAQGLHVIMADALNNLRSGGDLYKQVEAVRYGLVLQDAEATRNLGGRVPYALLRMEHPVGRGFLSKSVRVSLTQIAIPVDEYTDDVPEQLDEWVKLLQGKHWPARAEWRYQGPLDLLNAEALEEAKANALNRKIEIPEMSDEVHAEYLKTLEELGIDPADLE